MREREGERESQRDRERGIKNTVFRGLSSSKQANDNKTTKMKCFSNFGKGGGNSSKIKMAKSIKLTYFNVQGKGETIRLILVAAKVSRLGQIFVTELLYNSIFCVCHLIFQA